MVRVIIKKISEARKKWGANLRNTDVGQNMECLYIFFKNCVLALMEVNLLMATIKNCTNKCYLTKSESNLKNKFLKYEKSEKLTFEFLIKVEK